MIFKLNDETQAIHPVLETDFVSQNSHVCYHMTNLMEEFFSLLLWGVSQFPTCKLVIFFC